MKRYLFAAAVLLASCESATVPERLLTEIYEYRLSTPALQVLRWPVGSTVRVLVAADADPARTAQLETSLAHAMDAWNAAALYGEVQLQQTSDLALADAVVLFSSTAPPVDMTGCPRGAGLAVTTFCLNAQDPTRLAVFPPVGGGAGRAKFVVTVANAVIDAELLRRLVAHELGHVLGIAQHSPRPSDLMFFSTLTTAFPSVSDRAVLQLLYHTRPDITP